MGRISVLKISYLLILLAISSPILAFAETVQIDLVDGWTLIGLPVMPQAPYTAESLGQEINAQGGVCDRIMRWDGGGWQTHLIGKPFGDFPIKTNEAYFVLCKGYCSWTVTGTPVTALSQELVDAWTLVNAPFETLTAESMGNSINQQGGICDRIMLWDGGGWQTHLLGMPFGDFPIKRGAGYFVLCKKYSTWDFSITPVTAPAIDDFMSPTSQPAQTLSGTKDPDTSIWINGVQKVAIDGLTAWSVSITLAEGQNNLSVTARNAAGLESVPVPVSMFLDTTPPTTPVITDDGTTTNYTNKLHAVWTAQDPQTEINEYQYAIGTSSGGVDVVNWTSCGTQAEITKTDLTLITGKTYYVSVKAKNNVGLWSSVGISDGILLNQSAPSIGSITPGDGTLSEVDNTISFHINANDLEGDAVQYKIVVDSQVVSDWNGSPDFDWQTTSQASGIRQAIVYVKDVWGNQNSGNIAIYLARKTINLP